MSEKWCCYKCLMDGLGREIVVWNRYGKLVREFICYYCHDKMRDESEKDRIEKLRLCAIYDEDQRRVNQARLKQESFKQERLEREKQVLEKDRKDREDREKDLTDSEKKARKDRKDRKKDRKDRKDRKKDHKDRKDRKKDRKKDREDREKDSKKCRVEHTEQVDEVQATEVQATANDPVAVEIAK